MRRRYAVALAIGVAALGLPAAAAAAPPTVNLGTPPSGFLKGPFPTLTFQAAWEPRTFVTHDIRTTFAAVGFSSTITGLTRFSAPEGFAAVGGSGQFLTQVGLDGHFDISAFASEIFDNVRVDGPVHQAGRFGVDSSPPAPGTFTLAGGAPFTNRLTVRASGGTSDGFSGVGYYEIRNDGQGFPGCSRTAPSAEQDGTGCGALTPAGAFQTGSFDKEITLAAGPDGLRLVWIRYRDRAQIPCPIGTGCLHDGDGNASTPTFDEVTLDTTAPRIALTGGENATAQAGVPVAFDAGASTDATSGIDPAGFRWDFKDGSPAVENAGPVVGHTYPGPGTYPGEVRGRDRAGNVAVFAFTTVVGAAPPAQNSGAALGPAPPAQNGGAGSGASSAATRPRVLGIIVARGRAFVKVNAKGVMRVRIETPKGRKLAVFRQAVDEGRNRLRVPRRFGKAIPDHGRLVLKLRVVAHGVTGPLLRRRIVAAALNPQPLPPRPRGARP